MNQDSRSTGLGDHLSAEDLAVLAEARKPDQAEPEAIEHLARCRSCMAAYADIVRYRAGWLVFPEAFREEPGPLREVSPRRQGVVRSWRAALLATAAGLVVVIGIAALWIGRIGPRPDAGPITALLELASAEGLVIPGGEAGAEGTTTLYRSAPGQEESARAVERLRADYENDPRSGREVHLLAAGLLASGRLNLASAYVADGLARNPDDPRLLTLAGIVAHRSRDLPEAERRLREALDASPGDLTAMLDLGLVLMEMRQPDRAGPCFNEVIRRAPRSALAERARRVLAGLPTP